MRNGMVRVGYTGLAGVKGTLASSTGDLAEGWGAMLRTQFTLTRSASGGSDRTTATRSGVRALVRSRRRTDESGAAAVEFALVLIPFLVLVFGLIQYGIYFFGVQAGSHAANSAVRQLSVGNCQSAGALQTYLNNQLNDGNGDAQLSPSPLGVTYRTPANVTVSTPLPATAVGGTVTLRFKFTTPNLKFPLLPYISDSSVTREVQARIEDVTDGGCPS